MLLSKILTRNEDPTNVVTPMNFQVDPAMQQPDLMQGKGVSAPQQGIFSRIGGAIKQGASPNEDGISFLDKLGVLGAQLRDDPNQYVMANNMLDNRRAEAQQKRRTAEEERKIQEREAMVAELVAGIPDLTPTERALITLDPAKGLQSVYDNREKVQRGISDGSAYELGTGGLRNLGGVDISPSRQAIIDQDGLRLEETRRQNDRNYQLGQRRAATAEGQLGVARQRESRAAANPQSGYYGFEAPVYYSDDEVDF